VPPRQYIVRILTYTYLCSRAALGRSSLCPDLN
jgi:hypothetical protein